MDYSALYSELTKVGIDPWPGATCPNCGQGFSDIRAWLRHRMEAHALPMSQYEEAEFYRMTDVMERSMPAPSVTSRSSMDSDAIVQVQTKYPRMHQCHLCPKIFTRAFALRNHVNTHTDERPFKCTICSKAFNRDHDRKVHQRLHSGEKHFQCGGELCTSKERWGCGKHFSRKAHLSRHFRSQEGQKCLQVLLDDEAKWAQTIAE